MPSLYKRTLHDYTKEYEKRLWYLKRALPLIDVLRALQRQLADENPTETELVITCATADPTLRVYLANSHNLSYLANLILLAIEHPLLSGEPSVERSNGALTIRERFSGSLQEVIVHFYIANDSCKRRLVRLEQFPVYEYDC